MIATNNNSAKIGTKNAAAGKNFSGKENFLTRFLNYLIKIPVTAGAKEIPDIHTTAG